MTGPGQILAGLLLATAGMQDTTSQERAGAEAEAQERTRAEAEAQERVIAEELEHLDEHLRFDGQADNAATHYRELFRELIRRRYLDERLDEAVWALENELLSDRELYEAPAMQEYLGEVERYREGLRKAIGTERVDFGIRREVGFDLLLPHLNHVRDLSRKLERTSRKLRIDGRMAESAEDLILMLGMAAQAAEDGVIISSLVGAATATVVATLGARWIDLSCLGPDEARTSGLNLPALRVALFLGAGALTAAAVALVGPIGFVGLLAPHLARVLVGPAHRVLVPATCLAGIAMLLGAEAVRQFIDLGGGRLHVGVLTALLGGPCFLWLLCTNRGWTR